MQTNEMTPPNYQFDQNGAYFFTLVTKNRLDVYGVMEGDTMQLNPLGELVRKEWEAIGQLRTGITIDQFVLMPNHLHAIVFIQLKSDAGIPHEKVLRGLIGRYRKVTTEKAGISQELWEPNFYERMIKNHSELQAFRDYIVHNPLRWRWDQAHLK